MSQSLPSRPSLAQLRKQAKELRTSQGLASLAQAQLLVAREYGFPSWPKLKIAVELITLGHLIESGSVAEVEKLLAASPKLANSPNAEGSFPLHLVAGGNRDDLVAPLLSAGAKLGTPWAGSAHTALSWAVTIGSYRVANRLVELGDIPDLFCAAGLGLYDYVTRFWTDGQLAWNPSRTGSSRFSESGEQLPRPPTEAKDQVSDALYIACRNGHLEVGRWLLDHGADPNWRGYCGAPPLAWAEFSGNPGLCVLLRERGALDDLADYEFRTTPKVFGLMVLAAWGYGRELATRLLADRTLVNLTGGYGTLLNAAVYNGQFDCVKVLLAFGADREANNAMGATPIELANFRGFPEIAEALRTT